METDGVADVGEGFLEGPPLRVAALKVQAVGEVAVAVALDNHGEAVGAHGLIIAEEAAVSLADLLRGPPEYLGGIGQRMRQRINGQPASVNPFRSIR